MQNSAYSVWMDVGLVNLQQSVIPWSNNEIAFISPEETAHFLGLLMDCVTSADKKKLNVMSYFDDFNEIHLKIVK